MQDESEACKIIERAKGIIMQEKNMPEREAYRLIQKYSVDRRRSMCPVAEAIILTREIAEDPAF
ncbi:MAG: ANTAR domain-containing protein [Candidatus Omnitrophota bacterium]